MFIPDPNFFSYRIRIKEFKSCMPKICLLSSRKYDPGCSYRIRIFNHPGSRMQGPKRGTESRIRIRNTGYEDLGCGSVTYSVTSYVVDPILGGGILNDFLYLETDVIELPESNQ